MFDLSITKLLVLVVIGLVIFGPDQLPKMARQFGGTLRDLRRMAEKARTDLQDGLGPEFADFDIADLNPKSFVRKHLLDDLDGATDFLTTQPRKPHPMDSGQRPPFDPEAT
ncbi:MAG TPA: sec-independent translocase [Streptosporangiaceae bacterium]|nr:sec-independent translocase [Streptosporangiaceae bacterium]